MSSSRVYREAALEKFVRRPVSRQMVSYLAEKASSVIRCEEMTSSLPTPPSTPPTDKCEIPSVESFISELVHRSQVQVATLMSSLVYLERLKLRLPPVAKGGKCTVHRIFLACLILAAKNLNDSSPKNKHWAKYSNCSTRSGAPFGFSLTEVNLMERQLLTLLDFDLRITKDDLLVSFEPFLIPIARKLHLRDQEELELQLLEEHRLREEFSRRSMSPTPSLEEPDQDEGMHYTPPQVPTPPSDSPASFISMSSSSSTHSRRASDATDITHLSIYSTTSKRASMLSLGSQISASSYCSSNETCESEPGLTSGSSSSVGSSQNSPYAHTPASYASGVSITSSQNSTTSATQNGIPLSMLAGGPKSRKNSKNIFMKFWQREEEKISQAMQMGSGVGGRNNWMPVNEHVLRLDDGRAY